jgi:hypothetical protein
MNANTMEGNCLCGAVVIKANANTDIEACHCGMCRRWSGGPLLGVRCGTSMEIAGIDNVATFDSSEWAERAFCKTCGTHLFYRFRPTNEYTVPAGLFKNQDGLVLKEQIFIDKKPAYYEFANQTEMLTEEQVFEKFSSE